MRITLAEIEGSTVIINCSTTIGVRVDWEYISAVSTTKVALYSGQEITRARRERCSVTGDGSKGEYNLKIESIDSSDAGTYICVDNGGYGPERIVSTLVVLSILTLSYFLIMN